MASSFSSPSFSTPEDLKTALVRQIRSHEVAIGELNSLSSSRCVYQKKGAIFFQTSIKEAITSEKRQLDLANTRLQKSNSS